MRSKRTNRKIGKTIQAMILDAYQEYCSVGYPKDPGIYFVKARPETLNLLKEHLSKGIISNKKLPENWGFMFEEDNRLNLGEIVFGPEQITIYWDHK